MRAQDIDIIELFNSRNNFVIPVYQRNYDWKIKHCKKLLDDIKKAEDNKINEYFLGSFVIMEKSQDHLCREHFIIDGQQRLTSITLLLLAIYNDPNISDDTRYMIRKLIFSDIDKDEKKLILKQIQKDDEFLRKIINKESFHKSDSNIINNYIYFSEEISKDGSLVSKILRGLDRLRGVKIILDSKDNPQLVFETLNSTGKKLNEADKIRNYVLMYENQEKLYHDYWVKIEKNCLQNLNDQNVSQFMKAFLTIENHQKISKPINDDDVYTTFKEYLEDKNNEEILYLMYEYSSCYHTILKAKRQDGHTDIESSLNHILNLQITALNPVILCILKLEYDQKITTHNSYEMIFLLENYIVRRSICSLSTIGSNGIILSLIKKIIDGATEEKIVKNFQEALFKLGDSSRFPMNKEVKQCIKTRKMHGGSSGILGRYLLSLLENERSKEKINLDQITIEHIMPQKLSPKWKSMLGEEYEIIHKEYLHILGNITLTGYNSELGNKGFEEKKKILQESKFRYLNKGLSKAETWSKNEILYRSERFTKKILLYYPEPDIDTINIDAIIECTLDDMDSDFTSTKVVSYEYNGQKYNVESKYWSNFMSDLCEKISNSYPVEFRELIINDPKFSHIVGFEINKFPAERSRKKINYAGQELFINTHFSNEAKVTILLSILQTLNLDTDIKIFIHRDEE